jgi:hypothetical protein
MNQGMCAENLSLRGGIKIKTSRDGQVKLLLLNNILHANIMFIIVIIRFIKYLVCIVPICLKDVGNQGFQEAFNMPRDSKFVSFMVA